jgi:hypothetical protein
MPNEQNERALGAAPQMSLSLMTTAEQFVIGVCRCWDAFTQDPDPALAWRELTPVFAYMNVMEAFCAFDHAFAVLHRHRPRTLRFEDTDNDSLGLDEARMLSGLACLQRGDARGTIGVLRDSLTQDVLPHVIPPLARVAAVLDWRGHRLPAWTSTTRYA